MTSFPSCRPMSLNIDHHDDFDLKVSQNLHEAASVPPPTPYTQVRPPPTKYSSDDNHDYDHGGDDDGFLDEDINYNVCGGGGDDVMIYDL